MPTLSRPITREMVGSVNSLWLAYPESRQSVRPLQSVMWHGLHEDANSRWDRDAIADVKWHRPSVPAGWLRIFWQILWNWFTQEPRLEKPVSSRSPACTRAREDSASARAASQRAVDGRTHILFHKTYASSLNILSFSHVIFSRNRTRPIYIFALSFPPSASASAFARLGAQKLLRVRRTRCANYQRPRSQLFLII